MIDLGLIATAKKAVAAKPRKYVTAAHVVAVCLQESHGVPYFNPTDAQYKANLRAAVRITGMTEAEIRKLIIIPHEIGSYKVSLSLADKFAKFRCEPGYWKRFHNLSNADRFYRSCSWGLGQLMGAHLQSADQIKRFMCDVNDQALWVAGMMDQLLIRSGGDIKKAYAGYNSGNTECKDPAVLKRCDEVAKYFEQANAQMKGAK